MPPTPHPSLLHLRTLTTTAPRLTPTTTQTPRSRFAHLPPPYPHGPSMTYKQRDTGLYGGSHLQHGNLVSPKNALKSRRTWRPNMHRKRLWSASLQKFVAVKVQARVLRTIDKVGGLDEYLLGNKPARIRELGVEGWRLRWEVMGRGKRGQGLAGGERKAGRKTEGGKKNGERVVGGDEHAFSVGEEVARAGHREDGPGIRTVEGHVEGSAEESSLVELDAGRFEDEMEDLKRPATAKESDGEREGILSKLRGLFSRRREER